MINNNHQNKLGFGWRHATHKLVTSKLVKKTNVKLPDEMRIDMEEVLDSCVAPDFIRKENLNFVRGHFADIDNPSNKPEDALTLVKRYAHKAIESNKAAQDSPREYYKRDRYLGYALHFLQDMLNPHHVHFEKLPKGDPERVAHRNFEELAVKIQTDAIAKSESTIKMDGRSFNDEILPEAMRKTKDNWKIIKSNKNANLKEIAAESLDNVYRTTESFLKGMQKVFLEATIPSKNPDISSLPKTRYIQGKLNLSA